jgi:anti-sigma28 factor (negative regulator of flagellin synthesis)
MIKGISSTNSTLFTTISKDKKENIQSEKVEKSKVDSIKEAVKNGTYKLDINKTASAMAERLI